MIDVIKLTPKVYSKESRGYQLLSRLYSAIFNSSKTYVDNSSIWESNIDNKLTDLRANTLNLTTKYSWDLDTLEALSNCFKYIKAHKGTKKALVDAINIILKAQHTNTTISDSNITIDNYGEITITLKTKLSNIDMVDDIVRLFMPSCLTYRVIYDTSDTSDVGTNYTDVIEIDSAEIINRPLFAGDSTEAPDYYINGAYKADWATQRLLGVDNDTSKTFDSSKDYYSAKEYNTATGAYDLYNYFIKAQEDGTDVINNDASKNERFISNTTVYTESEFNGAVPEGTSANVGAYKTKVVSGDAEEDNWV